MQGYELTDFEWRVIEPLLPNKPRGVPRVDDRRVLNGLLGAADGRHGVPCQRSLGRRRPATTGLCAGVKPGFGIA